MRAKQKCQRTSGQYEYTKGNELVFCWWIVIPTFRYVTVAVGSGFSPRERIRPN